MLFDSPLENEIRSQMLLAFRGVTEAGQSRETFDAYLAKIDYKAENKEDADEMYRLYSRFVRSLMPWISSNQSRNRTRPPRAPRSKAEKRTKKGANKIKLPSAPTSVQGAQCGILCGPLAFSDKDDTDDEDTNDNENDQPCWISWHDLACQPKPHWFAPDDDKGDDPSSPGASSSAMPRPR